MQTETRSMLGLLIWVSIAYPQISMATNKGCGHMANPSWSVNAFAKHIIMHLYQYPLPVTWGGDKSMKSLVLAQPTIKNHKAVHSGCEGVRTALCSRCCTWANS